MKRFCRHYILVLVTLLTLPCAASTPGSSEVARVDSRFTATKIEYRAAEARTAIDLIGGRPSLSVKINGVGPFGLLLDVTSRTVVLDDRVARDAGLTTIGTSDDGAVLPNGVNSADRVHVNFLSIDSVMFRDFDAIVVDLDAMVDGRRTHDGTVPLSFFSDELITVDYPGSEIVLKRGELPAPDGKTVIGCTDQNGMPTFKLALADLSVDVAIDIANQMACTFPPDMKEQVTAAYGQAPGEGATGPHKKVDSDKAGRLRIGQHEVVFAPFEIKPGAPTIGAMILHHFAVTLDQKNRRVRFAREETEPIQFSFRPKYGVEFERHPARLVVLAVFPDSPIDKSFVKVGSRVVRIEGRLAVKYTNHELQSLMERSDSLLFELDVDGIGLRGVIRTKPRKRR